MDIKETDILGDQIANHWYYHSKAVAMMRLIAKIEAASILDVGAGSAFFTRHLLSHSAVKEAWCVDTGYKCDSDEDYAGKHIHFRRTIDAVNADLVLLMDVLEHVENDVSLLTDYTSKVPSGTQFLISVPAFQFLWSGHDVFLGHKRRYQLKEIESVARQAGLTVKHGNYYFGVVFPLAVVTRFAGNILGERQQPRSQLKQHSSFVNGILSTLSSAEHLLMQHNRIVGLTAFCLAESR
ncbi:hypothetical protein AGMMS50256_29810 [Betaproteobacteria bacterium]|nr:hypothetical protein AGMMS50256_29810 [Betaproteobacteria bacterium]